MPDTPLTYKSAGVDIDSGSQLVERIKSVAKSTHQPGVLGGIGGFGALFEIPLADYKSPVLVSATDGVGTKLKLALEAKQHHGIGIDLVAMCVNDIIVQGARPLFFLDYFATGHLDIQIAETVITGIADGCQQASVSLIGGETAEMPGMYVGEDYDVAGFCVGIVDKAHIIDGSTVQAGDALIAIASSGLHANGFSLVRTILQHSDASLRTPFGDHSLGEELLKPTRIYVKAIAALTKACSIKAISHITGGGLYENIPRVIPSHLQSVIESSSWSLPEIFSWLQTKGNLAQTELYRTFNCGIGMIVCVAKADVALALSTLNSHGERAWKVGQITERDADAEAVLIQ